MSKLGCRLDPCRAGRQATLLETNLRRLVIGQDDAITQIVNLFQTYFAGMTSPGRPLGCALFLGPTGSGKTRLVEATAESLFGNSGAILKIDCAEYQHSHEIAKLVGAPPGYLGHRETHAFLSQSALDQYHTQTLKISMVLFDEIEKASDSLWNLLLGVLDKATLVLGDNRRTDFSNSFIFMTGNLGATEMEDLVRPKWGFRPGLPAVGDTQFKEKLSRIGIEAARRKFTPEFVNRLDSIVVFNPLGERELRKIIDIELARVQARISRANAAPFTFRLTEAAIEQLLIEGTDPRYGARHLRRAIERMLVQPISNLLASEQVRGGDYLTVDSEPHTKQMVFWLDNEAYRSSRARG